MPSRPIRIVTQGPSEPVRVVTQGIADPVRIISGTPSDPVRVVTSGISTPVKIVEGSLDPIGDGLRADDALSVQYSGGNWIDPTGAHIWTNVNGATSTSSAYGDMVTLNGSSQYIRTPSDTPDLAPGNNDFTLVAAVIVSAFPINPAFAAFIAIKDNSNGDDEIELDITSQGGGHYFRFLLNDAGAYPDVQSVTYGAAQLGVLTLVFAWYDHNDQSINIQIDNSAIDTTICPNPNGTTTTPNTFDIGTDSAAGTNPISFFNGQILLHFYNRKLTQDEKDYFWNSGAGRALFP